MNIQIAFDGVKVSEDLHERVNEVFLPIDKLLRDFDGDLVVFYVRVEKRSSWGYKIGVNVEIPGRDIYAEEKGADMMVVLRKTRDSIKRQVRKHVERLRDRK